MRITRTFEIALNESIDIVQSHQQLMILLRALSKILDELTFQRICMAGWQALPPSHTNPLKFSNFQTTIKCHA